MHSHPPPARPARVALLAAALLAGTAAHAHDTWFERKGTTRSGATTLALGTGAQYPTLETAVGIEHLQTERTGCRQHDGSVQRWLPVARASAAMIVLTPPLQGPRLSCWAQLHPHDIELDDETVAIYLDEIAAPPLVRAAWSALRARGVGWKERYTKHARIELASAHPAGGPIGAARPVTGLGMDVLLDAPTWPPRAGEPLTLQVLRDGTPLADFAVELRGRDGTGTWLRTDADGRVRYTPPRPGGWLLRGTDLRRSPNDADAWDSRFVTLTFEVAPARRGAVQTAAIRTAAP
jgi:uncharacterized protein DUF4198